MACDETPCVKISLLFPRKIQIFKSTPFPWQSQKSLGHPPFEKKDLLDPHIQGSRVLQILHGNYFQQRKRKSIKKKDIVEFDKQIDTNLIC